MNKNKKQEKDVPFQSVEFAIMWNDFLKYRNELGVPITATSERYFFKLFQKFKEDEVLEAINKSIFCGWVGVFPMRSESFYYINK